MPDNVALIQAMYEAFGRGDMEAVTAALHDELEWNEAEHSPYHRPGGYHGVADVMANVFARLPGDFDGFDVVPKVFHGAGATVVVEARYQGTGRTTSEPFDAQACHVWTVRDGKVAAFQQYVDTWQFGRVAGHEPG